MGKTFWIVIISFWMLCICGGTVAYSYIVHEQKEERKQFVAQYDYEAELVEDEPVLPPITGNYPLITYSKDQFLKTTTSAFALNEKAYSTYQQLLAANNLDEAQKQAITYYTEIKALIGQFGNNAFIDVTDREKLFLEKMAYHMHYYTKYSSLYFIIGAKKLNGETATLNEQHTAAYTSLVEAKNAYKNIVEKYEKEFK